MLVSCWCRAQALGFKCPLVSCWCRAQALGVQMPAGQLLVQGWCRT